MLPPPSTAPHTPDRAQSDKVATYMTKFKRSRTQPYTLITPSTPLADLEQFLQDKLFALGTSSVPNPPPGS